MAVNGKAINKLKKEEKKTNKFGLNETCSAFNIYIIRNREIMISIENIFTFFFLLN